MRAYEHVAGLKDWQIVNATVLLFRRPEGTTRMAINIAYQQATAGIAQRLEGNPE